MDERLTEANFAKQLNTVFQVKETSVELQLVEVKGFASSPNDPTGMERFSLFFSGPSDLHLPQRTYALEHKQLGSLDIFLVTIAQNERGFVYEAVFNYFK
jgi:hypothetical protein